MEARPPDPSSPSLWRRAAMVVAVVALAAVAWQYRGELHRFEQLLEQHRTWGAVAYVVASAASVVLLPLSSLPLVPLATRIWGVWLAGVLSAAGWWLGALIAFWSASRRDTRRGRRSLAPV